MGSLMCVDIDLNSDAEENGHANGASHEENAKTDVVQVLDSEVQEEKTKGNGALRWLELDELGIDDDMLLSLNLSDRFPVSNLFFPIILCIFLKYDVEALCYSSQIKSCCETFYHPMAGR